MKHYPKISFLILTYNQEGYIYDAIMSGVNQDYKGEMEIIVSDDAYTDGTWNEIGRAIADNSSQFIIKVHRQKKNLGIGGNMRDGLSSCTGDIIVYNDGDDMSVSNRVSRVVEIFNQNPEIQLVSGEINWLINNTIYPIPAEKMPKSSRKRSLKDYIDTNFAWDIWGCTPSYKRALIDKFPPMLSTTPTSDTWMRLRAMMYNSKAESIFIDNQIHVNYRIHNNQITNATNIRGMKRRWIFKQYICDWSYAIWNRYITLWGGNASYVN